MPASSRPDVNQTIAAARSLGPISISADDVLRLLHEHQRRSQRQLADELLRGAEETIAPNPAVPDWDR